MTDLLTPQEVAELLEATEIAGDERRASARRPFPVTQRIAPYDGTTVPEVHGFFEVHCCDLSERGISFQWRTRPQYRFVIVELKLPGKCIYIASRVVHTTRVDAHTFRVGCQFVERMEIS